MTQNTRRSTTETWQAQAQENLEHSAQQEASILDLAQARFLDEARSAGAMSDMQLTDLVAEQLLERNNAHYRKLPPKIAFCALLTRVSGCGTNCCQAH